MTKKYEVVVGNIGTVTQTNFFSEAEASFDEYKHQIIEGSSRAEWTVVILRDGEPMDDYDFHHEYRMLDVTGIVYGALDETESFEMDDYDKATEYAKKLEATYEKEGITNYCISIGVVYVSEDFIEGSQYAGDFEIYAEKDGDW